MKIYCVSYHDASFEHQGYEFVRTKREAKRKCSQFLASNPEGQYALLQLNVTLTKVGVLRALNLYGGHPDNG